MMSIGHAAHSCAPSGALKILPLVRVRVSVSVSVSVRVRVRGNKT